MDTSLVSNALSAKAARVSDALGIATLKLAMDTQKNAASAILEETAKAAYQSAGIGQNVDIRV